MVCLRTEALHQTGNLFILLDCSSVSSFVRRAEVFEYVSHDVPTRMHFVVTCYEGPADILNITYYTYSNLKTNPREDWSWALGV